MSTVKVRRWGGYEYSAGAERFCTVPPQVTDVDLDKAPLSAQDKQALLSGETVCWYDEYWKLVQS